MLGKADAFGDGGFHLRYLKKKQNTELKNWRSFLFNTIQTQSRVLV